MLDVLTAPELWIGLMLMFAAYAWMGRSNPALDARLNRVVNATHTNAQPVAAEDSLRKRDPSSETAFGQVLAGMGSISKLRARFEMAGMKTTPQRFIGIMLAIGCVSCLIACVFFGKPLLVGALFGIFLGLALPHMAVNRRIKKRQRKFLKLFPDAIDLMVRGLRAGLPIGESFITVSHEVSVPVGDHFAAMVQQVALGVPMEKALSDTALKLGMTEFNFFVTSIILQRETGGNLGEILSNLAEMLRARQMMKLKIGALSSEARASAYIVGALPLVVMALLQLVSPQYLLPLFNDYRGNLWLAGAAGSMGFGALVMGKMTQLEI